MVLLSAVVLGLLFRSRVRAVRERQLKISFFKVYQGGDEPEYARKPARHFINLFEAPTLFYVACLAAMITHQTGPAVHVLAWGYVAARVAHSVVHLGANRLRPRMALYFASWLILLGLWGTIAFGVAALHV